MLNNTELFRKTEKNNIELNSPNSTNDFYELEHMVTDIIKEISAKEEDI
mgnify:CR=1 FL=1